MRARICEWASRGPTLREGRRKRDCVAEVKEKHVDASIHTGSLCFPSLLLTDLSPSPPSFLTFSSSPSAPTQVTPAGQSQSMLSSKPNDDVQQCLEKVSADLSKKKTGTDHQDISRVSWINDQACQYALQQKQKIQHESERQANREKRIDNEAK